MISILTYVIMIKIIKSQVDPLYWTNSGCNGVYDQTKEIG